MTDEDKNEQDKRKESGLSAAAIAGGSMETVARHGAAAKEYLVAFSGVDHETGETLKRSLSSIAQSKVNPDYASQNIKQQAGYSAEVMSAADKSAKNIIDRDPTKWSRADDVKGYGTNHQIADLVQLDASGNPIPGTETQMKFVGSNPDAALKKLASADFQKYLDADAKIEVPADYFQGIQDAADAKIRQLNEQLSSSQVSSDPEKVSSIKGQIKKLEKIKNNLRQSSLSNDDAIFARTHPTLATAKKVVGVAHSAGMESAKYGAAIGGGMSIIKNTVALVRGDIEADEAIANVAKDTVVAGAAGYGTGFAGTALTALGKNCGSKTIQAMANSSLPAVVAQAATTAGKTLNRYFKGEIDGVECLEELGQGGVGMVSSAMFGAVGQLAIPIPIVGAMAGSMIGYALSSASYGYLTNSLKEAKLAREERIRIERECEEHIAMIREYREEMERTISQYLMDMRMTFSSAFEEMKRAFAIGDVDGYIGGTNKIAEALGGRVNFETFDEFDAMMLGGGAITL